MEKVKLPKEICYLLDKAFDYYKEDSINRILWSCIQAPYYNASHEINDLRHFTYKKENATLIAKAILFGYEPEETKEERKERKIKEKMKEYLELRVTDNKDLIYKLTNDLYNIAHGKK